MSSLLYIDNDEFGFSLNEDIFDRHVTLEMRKPLQFSADQNSVKVTIPIAVWEAIRRFSPARYDLVDCTDEEIRAKAIEEIDDRMNSYRESTEKIQRREQERLERGDPDPLQDLVDAGMARPGPQRSIVGIFGMGFFGTTVDDPIEEQYEKAYEAYLRRREEQCALRDKVAELDKGRGGLFLIDVQKGTSERLSTVEPS